MFQGNLQGNKMKQEKKNTGCLIKTILAMYIVTGLLLVVLAFIVSKAEKEEMVARIGVVAVYVISCMLGGFIIGKCKGKKKFVWGILVGAIYAAILIGIGVVIGMGTLPNLITGITAMAICVASGMLGGMIS